MFQDTGRTRSPKCTLGTLYMDAYSATVHSGPLTCLTANGRQARTSTRSETPKADSVVPIGHGGFCMSIVASKKVEARQKPPRDIIVCTRRKNRPHVFVAVCRQCRYRKSCKDFERYIQPYLFDGNIRKRKRRQQKKV